MTTAVMTPVKAFTLIALGLAYLVLVVIASVRANNGEFFRYPLTIRFIR